MCIHPYVDGVYVCMHPLFLGQMDLKRERIPAQPGVGGLPTLSLPGTYSPGLLMCRECPSRQRRKQAYFCSLPLSPSMRTVSQSLFPRDPEGLSKGQLKPTLLNDSENPHCPEASFNPGLAATHSFKISLPVTFVTL